MAIVTYGLEGVTSIFCFLLPDFLALESALAGVYLAATPRLAPTLVTGSIALVADLDFDLIGVTSEDGTILLLLVHSLKSLN
jgi:hypothetical protein